MQQLLRVLTAAVMTVACRHLSTAATAQPAGEPVAKQIQLTEKQVLGFIAAQKDMAPILEKIQGPSADQLPPADQGRARGGRQEARLQGFQ